MASKKSLLTDMITECDELGFSRDESNKCIIPHDFLYGSLLTSRELWQCFVHSAYELLVVLTATRRTPQTVA